MTLSDAGSLERRNSEGAPEDTQNQPVLQTAPNHLTLTQWLVKGLKAGFFVPPNLQGATPKPSQVLAIVALLSAIGIGAARLYVKGPAVFDAQAWLAGWWVTLLFVALAWWALPEAWDESEPKPILRATSVAGICMLWMLAELPVQLVYEGINLALSYEVIKLPTSWVSWIQWGSYIVYMVWLISVDIFVLCHFFGRTQKTAVFVASLIAATVLSVSQFNTRSWQEDYSKSTANEVEKPRLKLTQEVFEEQQALLKATTGRIAPQRQDRADVYGLVFAPYASEDVFLRESTMVSSVLRDRFDAGDRVIHLLNHGATTKTHPWATTANLDKSIQALAAKMDLEKDLLVVYLTSHGGSDFKLAASHWPLEVEALTPQALKQMLEKAGVRNRVIAVSACFAGGWADVLANDHSLIMTAADATHTSYGCGSRSELTFFGRALFDEQLRKTHSFEQAFNRAVPIIKQREIDADKKDGFSNPQIRIGSQIRPFLKALEQRLDAPDSKALPVSISQ
jgi:Peptidase C13 family